MLFLLNKSAIRVLNASPGSPPFDIYWGEELVVQELSYEELTDYREVVPGEYNVKVFVAGETINPVIDIDLSTTEGELTSIAVSGLLPGLGLLPAVQTIQCPVSEQALIRFVHLAPDAPRVDVNLPDKTSFFTEVEYQEVTEYQKVKGGTYQLHISPSGFENTVLNMPELVIKPGLVYSIYLLGRLEGQPDLKLIMVTDSTEHCRQTVLPPIVPDVRPYQWRRPDIKVRFR